MTWRRKTIVLIVLLIFCFCTSPSDCSNGTYDDQCNTTCCHCEQTSCNNSTEFCTGCSTGYYGDFCNKTCDGNCFKNDCHQNGTCKYGCSDKSFYGNECNLKCSDSIKYCQECVSDGLDVVCQICNDSFFGEKCEQQCLDHCQLCNNETNCIKCLADFTGLICDTFCNISNCEQCNAASNICLVCQSRPFGDECEHNCTNGCLTCKAKSDLLLGSECNWCNNTVCSKGCQSGLWGDKCQKNCSKTGFCMKCDQNTGACIQCSDGRYGIHDDCNLLCGNCKADSFGYISCDSVSGSCSGECHNGSYGSSCNQSCPQNCRNNYCYQNGTCFSCKHGFYGQQCEKTCNSNCGSDPSMSVKKAIVCEKQSGQCEHCNGSYYGEQCQNRCPENCENVCNKSDGKCIFCQAGYYGDFCERGCNTNCDSQHSDVNGSCDMINGSCFGCKIGWYNDTCGHACSMGCRNHQCHRFTAECLFGCVDGYDGTYCQNVKAGSAGIVLGVVIAFLVILVIAVAGVCFIRRKSIMRATRRRSNSSNEIKMKNFNRHSSERNPLINGVNKLPVPARSFKSNAVTDEDLPYEDVCYVISTDPSDYYNLSSHIPVGGFSEYIQKQRAENPEWFKEHFAKLPRGLLKNCNASTSIANRGKCRYKQLYPYDINRVKLEPDGDAKSDFINASYVSGYKHTDAFIAAQGPTESTLDDFWRMIWQKNCGKVVMLTNMFEDGKMKCTRYWPDSDAPKTYGQIKVTLVTEDELPDYTVRHFQATHVDTMAIKGIKHFHFMAWPDRGVPEHPSCMLNFRERVMSEPTDLHGPILVHCSAGIGRTGTFVALDYLLRQSHEESHIDVFRVITDMRYQRTNFVQTDIQYEFLHNAIAEALMTKGMEVSVNDFCNHYWSLLECLPGSTTKTKLEDQFEILQQISPVLDSRCFSAGLNDQNIHKNRYAEILPVDMFRVYLSTPVKGSNEYINAVFLPTCTNKTTFVLTQMPLPHTVTDFWRLVYDQRVSTIVMMNNIDDDDETVGEYWPSEDSTFGPFRVELLSCNQFEVYSLITIHLTYTSFSRESKMTVRLYRFEAWLDHETVPTSTNALLSFILEVSRSPKETVNEPTIVHCMNGVERSGLYCVLAAILQRLQTEQKLNIPQTILQLRNRRPQLIETLKQYDFCHKVIADYLESNQIYSNVL